MQIPAWVLVKIQDIPNNFHGEIKIKVIHGGVMKLYIEERLDKPLSDNVVCKEIQPKETEG